jgi:hypothetical protein
MNKCSQCDKQNSDTALVCAQCGQALANAGTDTPVGLSRVRYQFSPLTPEDKTKDMVTLLNCATLPEADVILSHLEGAGIAASTPDEYRMTLGPFELDQLYRFRVQVAPADFEAAKELLEGASEINLPGTLET